jgi:uncharacterized hydrophobic protein (TIGR00271 family)
MSILAVITREEEIQVTLQWASRFALAKELPLHVIYPSHYPQEKAPSLQPLDQTCSIPMLETIRETAKQLDGEVTLYHLQGPDRLTSILSCIKEHKAKLLVTGHSSLKHDRDSEEPSLRKSLLEEAPCDVMLLRGGEHLVSDCDKILIPTSGGPHAQAALQLGLEVSKQNDAHVKAILIEQEAGEYAEALGQRILKRVLKDADVEPNKTFDAEVVLADDVHDGILQAAKAEGDVDLLLLGASNVGFMRRAFFGTVPDRFLEGKHQMTIGVVRSAQPLMAQARQFAQQMFERFVPQLEREARIDLFERLQNGSRTSIDFIALICLSTAIAALGLLQNSGAVIIGAMLVAPLMTPMLGMGLGLVQGNIVLVKQAVSAIAIGFFLSFMIGLFIGLLTPSFHTLTPEMLGRGSPNLLDLFVALLSGVAAAYALGRPGLLEALPGVAIAAALVPPIATAGASLAIGHTSNAVGAASLFGINLIAIILASAGTLFVLGVRANQKQKRLWARRIIIGLMMLALFTSFPLATALLSRIPSNQQPLRKAVTRYLQTKPKQSLASMRMLKQGNTNILVIEIFTPKQIGPKEAQALLKTVKEHITPKTKVRVASVLVTPLNKPTKRNMPPSKQTAPTSRPAH